MNSRQIAELVKKHFLQDFNLIYPILPKFIKIHHILRKILSDSHPCKYVIIFGNITLIYIAIIARRKSNANKYVFLYFKYISIFSENTITNTFQIFYFNKMNMYL